MPGLPTLHIKSGIGRASDIGCGIEGLTAPDSTAAASLAALWAFLCALDHFCGGLPTEERRRARSEVGD